MRARAARKPDRGQSELIGTVLLLGIVIAGAGVAVAFGTTALEAARDDSRASSVEHAMTQFDATAAMVALGSSNSQEMRLAASGDGTYDVNDDAGWIRVSHANHSTNGNTEVLTNTTLFRSRRRRTLRRRWPRAASPGCSNFRARPSWPWSRTASSRARQIGRAHV